MLIPLFIGAALFYSSSWCFPTPLSALQLFLSATASTTAGSSGNESDSTTDTELVGRQ